MHACIYPLLAEWIKNQRPNSKISFGGMQGGLPSTIDVVEVNEEGELIGYEVKMTHEGLQIAYIIQGIGQAIEYLYFGMDQSYLVAPRVVGLKYLPDMLKRTVPLLGLILFDRNLNFKEVIKAKKIQIYPPHHRKLAEFSYLAEDLQMDRHGRLTWTVRGVKHTEEPINRGFNKKKWREIVMDARWQEIKTTLEEFPELNKKMKRYLTETAKS